jgi:hypothetical protein
MRPFVMGGVVTGGLIFTCVVNTAEAAPIYDSGGFETLVNGDLTNQDPAGPWLQSGNGTAVVQQLVKQAGQKAVQVTRSANNDARWGVVKPVANVAFASPAGITVDWDMNVPLSAVGGGGTGPFFGVEAYDALDNGPLLAGSLGVNAATGAVVYQRATTGEFVTVPGLALTPGFNHFKLVLNYVTDTYSAFVNGLPVATEGFVDPGIDDFTDAPIATLAMGGDAASQAATGSGYFDNYAVNTVAVPEPTMAWVGIGCLVLMRRNRSQSTCGAM